MAKADCTKLVCCC